MYGSAEGLAAVFPAMAPCSVGAEGACGRSVYQQASMQLAALGSSVLTGIVGGLLTGCFVRLRCFEPLKRAECFDDEESWNIEDGDKGERQKTPDEPEHVASNSSLGSAGSTDAYLSTPFFWSPRRVRTTA